MAVLVLSGAPVFAQSARLYLTARAPLDERGRQPIGDVIDVDASTALRVYVVVEAPATATRDKRLRVTAVNQSPSPVPAPPDNLTVRVFRVDGAAPIEVPVRIQVGGVGGGVEDEYCELSLDVAQLPPHTIGRPDRDRVLIGMTRSAILPIRNPPGLYEVRVTWAPSPGHILYAPNVRFRVSGEPSPPMPLPQAAPAPAHPPSNTPTEVVTAYYRALNEGDHDTATRVQSSASLALVTLLPPPAGDSARDPGLHPVTQNGTIVRIEILDERHIGDRAWVDVRLHYESGASQKYNAGVVQEDGEWKVGPN